MKTRETISILGCILVFACQAALLSAATFDHNNIPVLPLLLGQDKEPSFCNGDADCTSSLPRIQADNLKYLGAFALPGGTFGDSRFGYSGQALAPYTDPHSGKKTLFMQGHAHNPGTVAQIEIPTTFVKSQTWSELPKATVLQDFKDITDNKWDTLGSSAYESLYGLLPYNGRLIVAGTSWYDASCSQTASHGVSSFDISNPNDFQGFYTITATANARSLGGYMTTIPQDWQPLFGGPALTGNAALSIISCISSGPAATVFDPDEIGRQEEISGTTMVYYPLSNHLKSGGVTDVNTFTFGSSVKGIAFPAGTRTVLFIGRQTLADGYCYGPGTDDPALHKVPTPGGTWCYDPCNHSKGGHGYPYYHWVWAYDANDFLMVKNGKKKPWEITPYATWKLEDLHTSGCASIRGAGYDHNTQRLYITQGYGEEPKVDVYYIEVPVPPEN